MAVLKVRLPIIPPILEDEQFTRYLLAGGLYLRGVLSGEQARELTGDSRRVFEERMSEYGFPMMPDDEDEIAAELEA